MMPSDQGWPRGLPITVVIPALNAGATLAAQLSALAAQTFSDRFEVILVDNGSNDGTADLARTFESARFTVRVVTETRRGVNYARNAGVDAAADGLVALCDADDVVVPEWLASLAAAWVAGVWLAGDLDFTLLNSADTRLMWGVPDRIEHRGERPFLDTAFGGNCAFARSMWEQIGGFDETLSGHGDEGEFFLRAWQQGHRAKWAAGAVIHCRLRPGLQSLARQRYRKGKANVLMESRPGGALLPRPNRALVAKSWAYIVLMAPLALVSKSVRIQWLRVAPLRAGRLVGRAQSLGNHR